MSKLPGIEGILGNYVSPPSTVDPGPRSVPSPRVPDKIAIETKSVTKRRNSARLGRPPGRTGKNSRAKEKATLRIDTELMADYRDWSWDVRCQLGELIERALAEYRKRHR